MEFLDRIEERDRLTGFLVGEGGMACLYGRRRVGKSRLLMEVLASRADVVFHIADRSESVLQRRRLAGDISKVLDGFDQVSYPDWGVLFDRWRREAPPGSVLVIDEFPYLVEQSPELPSVLQRVLENIGPTGLKIIICGSSQRMMQGLVLDQSEPLYGRAKEILNLQPLGFKWLKKAFPKLGPTGWLEHYGVWGGVPRYWELSIGEKNLMETIRRQVFSPLGLLRTEPNYLLLDDLSDSVQASSVLALIGMGAERMSEIASRLQMPVTALTRPVKRLLDLGLIRKETPFACDSKGNKKSLYRVSDPFLAFWYRFVLPNFSDEHYLEEESERISLKSAYRTYLGGVWETVVRDTLGRRRLPGFDFRFRHAARWWGSGLNREPMELDVVAESVDGKTLLVGEVKLRLTKIEADHAMSELRKKASLLPFARKYENVVCRLFVAEDPREDEIGLEWVVED